MTVLTAASVKSSYFEVVVQRTFFIKTKERLMYMYYKKCNYFLKNKAVFIKKKFVISIFCAINRMTIDVAHFKILK